MPGGMQGSGPGGAGMGGGMGRGMGGGDERANASTPHEQPKGLLGLLKKDDESAAVPGSADGAKDPLGVPLAEADTPGRTDSARRRKKERDGISQGEGALFSKASTSPIEAGPDYGYQRLRFHKGDEVNPYAQVRDAQVGMDSRMKKCIGLGVLVVVALLCAILIPSGWFDMNLRGATMSYWLQAFQQHVRGFVSLITLQGSDYSMDHLTYRYLIVAFAGAALGISGAVYQGSLKNALASPSTLGVMTGCNAGRIVYALFFLGSTTAVSGLHATEIMDIFSSMSPLEYLWEMYGMAFCALIGGFAIAAFVLAISTVAGHGRVSSVVMIIAGQVAATLISALISLLQYYFTETGDARAELIRGMQVQSFAYTTEWLDVVLVGVPIALCIFAIMRMRTKLNLLAFSDDEARSMGLSTQRCRWAMVGICTALTGIVVSFCGQVGMVGFMVPHLTRKFIGPDFKYLIPASALMGAAFLVIAYFIASLFGSGILSSFGVFTSLIGTVVFLVLALRQRGQTRGDWL